MKVFLFFLGSFWFLPMMAHSQFNTIIQVQKTSKIDLLLQSIEVVEERVMDTIFYKPELSIDFYKPNNYDDELDKLRAYLPLPKLSLTSSFGYRRHPITGNKNSFHTGVDLVARKDTVYSILLGVVEDSGYDRILGNYIKIKHGNYTSIFGHLSTRFVLKGESVTGGFPIGITGNTGRSTGEHLHFTIKHKNKYINPLAFLASVANLDGHDLYFALQSDI